MSVLKLDEAELVLIADILLAAAHADSRYDGSEAEAIEEILESLVEGGLPDAVQARFDSFDIDEFDVAETCAELNLDVDQREGLFALIARVIEADDVLDYDESDFLRQIAAAVGAEPGEVDPFLVKFIEVTPPPVP